MSPDVLRTAASGQCRRNPVRQGCTRASMRTRTTCSGDSIRRDGLAWAAMTTPNERDEFERMRLTAQIERAREIITQYEVHQEFYRRQVEDSRYELGRLDERLGG